MLTCALAAGVLASMAASAAKESEASSPPPESAFDKEDASDASDYSDSAEAVEWSAEDEDLFWASEAEASLCWIYILDRVYLHDVGALLFTWVLIIVLSSAELVAGFFGCFRLVSSADGVPLASFNAWEEPLLWLNTLRFAVALSACTGGLAALQRHHRATSRLKGRTFSKTFDAPLALHGLAFLLTALSLVKLSVLAWRGNGAALNSSAEKGGASDLHAAFVSLSAESRRPPPPSFLHIRGKLSLRSKTDSVAFSGQGLTPLDGGSFGFAGKKATPGEGAGEMQSASRDFLPEKGSESPLYQPLLLSCLGMDGPLLALHAVAFWLTWRIAKKVGRLFGVRMPKLPF